MSQKFILSGETTAKKRAFFEQQRPKKFSRKRSERDRSFESKKSNNDSICSHYIKTPSDSTSIKFNLVSNQSFFFLDDNSTSTILPHDSQRKPRKAALTRTNGTKDLTREQCTQALKIKILETQMKAKDGECERFKSQAQEERKRRTKAELDRKTALKQSASLKNHNESLLIQIKKLTKEKQILCKQIEFLQKINYDEKTRNIQSFRQKYMQEELLKLRDCLQAQKSKLQVDYEQELYQMRWQKETAQEKFRSMESLVAVLRRSESHLREDIMEQKLFTKEKIINSDLYRQLRERFKRFVDQYKEVRNQNSNLMTMLQERETQFVLSEEERDNN